MNSPTERRRSSKAEDDTEKQQNVIVGVRIRPLNTRERLANATVAWIEENNNTVKEKLEEDELGRVLDYTYDYVFNQNENTQSVYEKMTPNIVKGFFDGYNGTIFAYGQTSSGKTHTLMGSEQEPGIIILAIQDVFEEVEKMKEKKFIISVSYIEIYNEELKDLLSKDRNVKLDIVEDKVKGPYVKGAREVMINCIDDALQLLAEGETVRHVGSTNMNARSSRSHTLFKINLESRNILQQKEEVEKEGDDEAVDQEDLIKPQPNFSPYAKHSALYIVDLAGSERMSKTGASGERLKEGSMINRSLLSLSKVIEILSSGKKKTHIPYRDSKLTRLLSTSLGGNAKTAMISTISPASSDKAETRTTLEFSKKAKTIVNKIHVNEVVTDTDALYKMMSMENKRLRQLIEDKEKDKKNNVGFDEKNQNLLELQPSNASNESDGKVVLNLLANTLKLQQSSKQNAQLVLDNLQAVVSGRRRIDSIASEHQQMADDLRRGRKMSTQAQSALRTITQLREKFHTMNDELTFNKIIDKDGFDEEEEEEEDNEDNEDEHNGNEDSSDEEGNSISSSSASSSSEDDENDIDDKIKKIKNHHHYPSKDNNSSNSISIGMKCEVEKAKMKEEEWRIRFVEEEKDSVKNIIQLQEEWKKEKMKLDHEIDNERDEFKKKIHLQEEEMKNMKQEIIYDKQQCDEYKSILNLERDENERYKKIKEEEIIKMKEFYIQILEKEKHYALELKEESQNQIEKYQNEKNDLLKDIELLKEESNRSKDGFNQTIQFQQQELITSKELIKQFQEQMDAMGRKQEETQMKLKQNIHENQQEAIKYKDQIDEQEKRMDALREENLRCLKHIDTIQTDNQIYMNEIKNKNEIEIKEMERNMNELKENLKLEYEKNNQLKKINEEIKQEMNEKRTIYLQELKDNMNLEKTKNLGLKKELEDVQQEINALEMEKLKWMNQYKDKMKEHEEIKHEMKLMEKVEQEMIKEKEEIKKKFVCLDQNFILLQNERNEQEKHLHVHMQEKEEMKQKQTTIEYQSSLKDKLIERLNYEIERKRKEYKMMKEEMDRLNQNIAEKDENNQKLKKELQEKEKENRHHLSLNIQYEKETQQLKMRQNEMEIALNDKKNEMIKLAEQHQLMQENIKLQQQNVLNVNQEKKRTDEELHQLQIKQETMEEDLEFLQHEKQQQEIQIQKLQQLKHTLQEELNAASEHIVRLEEEGKKRFENMKELNEELEKEKKERRNWKNERNEEIKNLQECLINEQKHIKEYQHEILRLQEELKQVLIQKQQMEKEFNEIKKEYQMNEEQHDALKKQYQQMQQDMEQTQQKDIHFSSQFFQIKNELNEMIQKKKQMELKLQQIQEEISGKDVELIALHEDLTDKTKEIVILKENLYNLQSNHQMIQDDKIEHEKKIKIYQHEMQHQKEYLHNKEEEIKYLIDQHQKDSIHIETLNEQVLSLTNERDDIECKWKEFHHDQEMKMAQIKQQHVINEIQQLHQTLIHTNVNACDNDIFLQLLSSLSTVDDKGFLQVHASFITHFQHLYASFKEAKDLLEKEMVNGVELNQQILYLQAQNNTISELQTENEILKKALNGLRSDNSKINNDMVNMIGNLQELNEKYGQLSREYEREMEKSTNLLKTLNETKEQHFKDKKMIQTYMCENENAKKHLATLENSLKQIQLERVYQEDTLTCNQNQSNEQLKALTNKCNNLQKHLNSTQEQILYLEKEVELAKILQDKSNQDVHLYKMQVSQKEDQIASLKVKINEYNDSDGMNKHVITKLERDLRVTLKQLHEAMEKKQAKEDEFILLQKKITDIESQNSSIKNDILFERLNEMRSQVQTQQVSVGENFNVKEKRIKHLETTNKELSSKNINLSRQIKQLTEAIDQCEREGKAIQSLENYKTRAQDRYWSKLISKENGIESNTIIDNAQDRFIKDKQSSLSSSSMEEKVPPNKVQPVNRTLINPTKSETSNMVRKIIQIQDIKL